MRTRRAASRILVSRAGQLSPGRPTIRMKILAPQLDRHVVTAVLVTHDGARWLPETLKALLTQSHPVDRLVAADTGSTDAGPAMLTEVVGEGNLLTLPPGTRYADAVTELVAHPASRLPVPAPDELAGA